MGGRKCQALTPIFPSSLFSFPFQGPPGPYGNPGLPGPPGAKVSVCCGVWRESRGTDAEVRAALGELLFLEAPGGWASGSLWRPQALPGASQVPGPVPGWRHSEELRV